MRAVFLSLIERAELYLPSDIGPAEETLPYDGLLGEQPVASEAVEEVIQMLHEAVEDCEMERDRLDASPVSILAVSDEEETEG